MAGFLISSTKDAHAGAQRDLKAVAMMEFQAIPGGEYLTIEVTGPFALEQAIDLTPPIFDACVEQAASKLFIDARNVTGTMTSGERLIYADSFANHHKARRIAGAFGRLQIAILGSPEIVDPQRLGERILTLRGVHAKVFTQADVALVWLRTSLPPGEGAGAPSFNRA